MILRRNALQRKRRNTVPWFTNPLWLHWTLQEHEMVTETLLIPTAHRKNPWQYMCRPLFRRSAETRPRTPAEPEVTDLAQDPITTEAHIAAPAAPAAEEDDDLLETEILIPGVSEPVSLIEAAPEKEAAPEIEAVTEPAAPHQ